MNKDALRKMVCPNHKVMVCPPKCWVGGRTSLSFYEGELMYARTFELPEDAELRVANNQEWTASKMKEYVDAGLPVPEQFGKWEYRVWNGDEHVINTFNCG